MNFARYLRKIFHRTPPGYCFCSTEKYFTNKIVKNSLRKEKKETACKKCNGTCRTKAHLGTRCFQVTPWNILSHFNQKVGYVAGKRLSGFKFLSIFYNKQ